MIDLAAVRTELAELFTIQFGDRVKVYRGQLAAVAEFPLIAVGTPRWKPDVQPCTDQVTLPVALAVRLPNDDGEVVQDSLEALWAELIEGLREDLKADPTLGGLVRTSVIASAEFGGLLIQGREYPAMNTTLDLYSIST